MKYSAFIIAATTVAIGLATPAAAKERRQLRAVPQNQYNQIVPDAGPISDPTGVYRNGRLVGRDPDPNIRMMIDRTNGNHFGPA